MRKIIALLLAAAMAMGMVACSGGETTEQTTTETPTESATEEEATTEEAPAEEEATEEPAAEETETAEVANKDKPLVWFNRQPSNPSARPTTSRPTCFRSAPPASWTWPL